MNPFTVHRGSVATLDRSNVDTDQIIPKQFLKRIQRTGFGQFLFFDWRFDSNHQANPDFELNRPEFRGASILVAKRNFGSGSSREHAVWALTDYGFRCVIAESFADIFYNNSFKNGLLPITLPAEIVQRIFVSASQNPKYELTISLEKQTVSDDFGLKASFQIDPHRKYCLLHGLDDIELTLKNVDKITAFETARGYAPADTN